MSESRNDNWEQTFLRANELWRDSRHQDAIDLLAEARTTEVAAGRAAKAAFFSNVLGSYLSLNGNTVAARAAYEDAVALEPANPHWHLGLGEHLLAVHDAPGEALEESRKALNLVGPSEGSTIHSARALEGICLAKLDRWPDAERAFLEGMRKEVVRGLPASACDLRLLALVVAHGESTKTREYAQTVAEKAKAEGRTDIAGEVEELLRRIRTED